MANTLYNTGKNRAPKGLITRTNGRRGISAVWMVVMMTGLCMVVSLAVDFGRVQVAKTELRRAVDASARAAAIDIASGLTAVRSTAKAYATNNKCDGRTLALQDADITVGVWNSAAKTFVPVNNNNYDLANSVRVATTMSAARGSAIKMTFASLLGFKSCDISTEAVALYVPPINVDTNILATANPYLAGMPAGTKASLNNPHNSPDTAGSVTGNNPNAKQSPLPVNMPLTAGDGLTFDSIAGTAQHDPALGMFSPDGELADIGGNTNGAELGKSNLIAPINALVGIFLDDSNPNLTAAPETLDFRDPSAREFSSLSPKVKQVFFIGDGRNSDGTVQKFIVPQGATRLYLATWDFFEWNNNGGFRNVQISRPGRTIIVR